MAIIQLSECLYRYPYLRGRSDSRHREWLRFCANVPASLHIQDIIARRQRDAIVSTLVCSHPRDFFCFVLTHDDQWIFRIGFRRNRRRPRHVIGRFNRPGRNNLQMSLHGAWRQTITRCSATGEHQKDAPSTQLVEEQITAGASRRGRDFPCPAWKS
jgi:hypothetical protein